MDPVIDTILTKLKAKYGISKFELEKIMDSEFKVMLDHIQSRGLKEINLIHLGKVRPSNWFKKNYEKFRKKDKGDL